MASCDLRDGGDQNSRFSPTSLAAGQPGQTLTVRMLLNSSGDASKTVYLDFYVSADASITTSDYYLGRTGTTVPGGNLAREVAWSCTFPTDIPPGSYYLGWIIDPENLIPEGDETNNIAYKSTVLLNVVGQSQPIIYVDVNARGTNTGSSWRDAFTSLQDALAWATSGNEIRVAQGTYTPDRGLGITRGDREASFALRSGVTIRGGYGGATVPDPNARDVAAYATILSGDLTNNDARVDDPCDFWKEASRADNSRHVLSAVRLERALLDGVQVTGGGAFGSSHTPLADDLQGAGLTMTGGDLILRNCTFVGNWASADGGAIHTADGRLELADCTFRANGAGTTAVQAHGTGGAIRSNGKAELILSHCGFYANFAGSQGGALDNDKGSATLSRCLFIQNQAVNSGGGAIWNSEGPLSLVNCILHGNHTDYSGGAIANGWNGILDAVNCCLHANTSTRQAGAIDNFFGGTATLSNCTLADNRQGLGYGAVNCGPALDQNSCRLAVTNCILWNGGVEIVSQGKPAITVARTDIQGGWADATDFSLDPLFAQPAGADGVAGTEDDDLHLQAKSPCLNGGDDALLAEDFADLDGDGDTKEPVPLDLDGKTRIVDSAVDLGAYEAQKD